MSTTPTKPIKTAIRRTMAHPFPTDIQGFDRRPSKHARPGVPFPLARFKLSQHCAGPTLIRRKEASLMQQKEQCEFNIEEARRVLGEVFAPWVQDLNLSVERIDHEPPSPAPADWQPGAILRMPFSERLCRSGGVVCGQALMAFADTAMVMANLAANRGYRPMTTVDQTTHFMRALAASDVLADARIVRLGRTMSFGRVTLSGAQDNKPVAIVSSAFAML
jgi:uncharacterized protein (TIGR00369 family)